MNNILASTLTRSNLMTAYNLARLSGKFESGRLNRAWGIVQSNKTRILPDGRLDVNINDWQIAGKHGECTCQDRKRVEYCKHRIARLIVFKAQQLQTGIIK